MLRGVGFRGGNFTDSDDRAADRRADDRAARRARAVRLAGLLPDAARGPSTTSARSAATAARSLLVTPAQHRAADIALGTSTLRKYTNLDLRLYYSGNLSQRRAVRRADDRQRRWRSPRRAASTFTAQVVGDPTAAIHQVWVTYTGDGADAWASLDLQQCVAPLPAACGTAEDSQAVEGPARRPRPPTCSYVVQAVERRRPRLARRQPGGLLRPRRGGAGATTLTLGLAAAVGTFGDTKTVTAKLKSGGTPLASKSVIVSIGGAARVGTTDGDGNVTVNVPLVSVPGQLPDRRLVRRRRRLPAVLRVGRSDHGRQGADQSCGALAGIGHVHADGDDRRQEPAADAGGGHVRPGGR